MMLAKTGLSEGCKSFFYWSIDKCHSWHGPFAVPALDRTGIAARTDYIVLGPQSCLMLLTANKADGKEGHVMAIKTADGGKTWRLASFLGPEPEAGFQIMPASVKLPSVSTHKRFAVACDGKAFLLTDCFVITGEHPHCCPHDW